MADLNMLGAVRSMSYMASLLLAAAGILWGVTPPEVGGRAGSVVETAGYDPRAVDHDSAPNLMSATVAHAERSHAFERRVVGASGRSLASSGDLVAPRGALDDAVGAFCSFTGTTAVLMADGATKALADVEVGDWVMAEDPDTGERVPRRVTHVWVHEDEVTDLVVDGEVVATTEDHPFWNATDRAPGSIWQRLLHPGGSGGYAEWAVPRGAPR